MNKIEKLVEEFCPNGVEWRELDKVIELKKGKQLNKELLSKEGNFPAYNGEFHILVIPIHIIMMKIPL